MLRDAWCTAARAEEIGEEQLASWIYHEPIVLLRESSNQVSALADRCCHRAAAPNTETVIAGVQGATSVFAGNS